MLLLKSLLLLSLVISSLARSDLRRNLSRHVRKSSQRRQVNQTCTPRRAAGRLGITVPAKGGTPPHPAMGTRPPGAQPPVQSFKQDVVYKGQDFLSQWDFSEVEDPTHGLVNYRNQDDARSRHLAFVDGGAVALAVDGSATLQPGQKRDSVRITSKKTWSGGLFIADIAQMPFGCAVWPAYWSVGPNWPNDGEIDVLEGVNNQATNQYTLHTSEGCTASKGSVEITGQPGITTRCATVGDDNTGCAYLDTDPRSYGEGFNSAGGGVFAHLWDHTGIKIWHFARSEIPKDIDGGSPNPGSWGAPAAFWSAGSCNITDHFHDHALVFDTTLCGDWAGTTYASTGCPGSCEEAVADPKNFQNAKWKINSVAVYQPA